MRIVDRATFLASPRNTVYSEFRPDCFDVLAIKYDTLTRKDGTPWSWLYLDIASAIEQPDGTFEESIEQLMAGESVPVCLDVVDRDGFYEEDQLFAVWEPDDIRTLIDRLSDCLP